ncbi:hypothetical protein GCM10009872_47150 [Actinopolymorpha rutila]
MPPQYCDVGEFRREHLRGLRPAVVVGAGQHKILIASGQEGSCEVFAQARDDTAVRGVATDEVSFRAVYEDRTRAYGVIGEHLAGHRTGEDRHQAELVIKPGEQRTDCGVRMLGEPCEQPSST